MGRVLDDALDGVDARVLDELPHCADAVSLEGVLFADADDVEGSRLRALHFDCHVCGCGEERGGAVSNVREEVAPVDCDQYLLFESVEFELLQEIWYRTGSLLDSLPLLRPVEVDVDVDAEVFVTFDGL